MILPQTQWIGGSYEAACGMELIGPEKVSPTNFASTILALLQRYPLGMETTEIASLTGRNRNTVRRLLDRMAVQGEVLKLIEKPKQRRGASRVARWVIST